MLLEEEKECELVWSKYEGGNQLTEGIEEARLLPIFAKKSLNAFAIDLLSASSVPLLFIFVGR